MSGGALTASPLASGATTWTFSGDGQIQTAPIVVGTNVVVGSASGQLYVIDAASGDLVSSDNVGVAIPAADEQNVSQPLKGLAEGDGVLVVPAGSTVIAY